MPRSKRIQKIRRGSAYLIVLGTTLIVAALAYAAILATRAKGRLVGEYGDAAQARRNAQAGVDLARLWMNTDANWRTNRTPGTWASDLSLGTTVGTVTIEASDPADSNFANFPHDSVLLKVTGKKGKAKHIAQVTIKANPTPISALQSSIHTGGQIHIRGGKLLSASGSTISTNGNLRNDGTINGNVQCVLALPPGTINGTLQIAAGSKPLPDSTIPEKYAALGTQISTTTLDKRLLSPAVNPYGTPNTYGIYVIRSSSDVTIKLTRIHGTLVVICPGKKVTIDNQVLLHPYRSDCPSLIVQGDVDLKFSSGATAFKESDVGFSLNPAGTPYNGVENSNATESFPSEIQGLVHVTGKIDSHTSPLIRGALLSNSTAGTDAVDINDQATITYTPGLYTNPPCWYTTAVPMVIDRGTWRQLAN